MERYSRQTMLQEIGEAGQLKLKAAKVLIEVVTGIVPISVNCLSILQI